MNFVPNFTPKLNRRAFVIGAAAAGGLALGSPPAVRPPKRCAPPTARPKSMPGW